MIGWYDNSAYAESPPSTSVCQPYSIQTLLLSQLFLSRSKLFAHSILLCPFRAMSGCQCRFQRQHLQLQHSYTQLMGGDRQWIDSGFETLLTLFLF
ncbi:hypothetical protein SADUNF_Sadunf06G0192000 [Salix dunnii]|uniref:Uncharacterized protein n=1 Tax=Salix dunnii TaxID=1413687 RepID=A0A835K867_9ROSI|nr:hypothetical protein SADUNF_Sadunf06G0192000 [Salix dunnii]